MARSGFVKSGTSAAAPEPPPADDPPAPTDEPSGRSLPACGDNSAARCSEASRMASMRFATAANGCVGIRRAVACSLFATSSLALIFAADSTSPMHSKAATKCQQGGLNVASQQATDRQPPTRSDRVPPTRTRRRRRETQTTTAARLTTDEERMHEPHEWFAPIGASACQFRTCRPDRLCTPDFLRCPPQPTS